MNLTLTTKKNFIVNAQKKNRKKFEHNTKENYQNTGKGKRRQKDIQEPEKHWENKQNGNKYIPLNNYFKHNGLNIPFKRCRVSEWRKRKIHTYAAYKRLILELSTHIDWRWRKGKFIPCKWKWNKTPECLYSRQTTQNLRQTIIKDKEGHYIKIKESIQWEDICTKQKAREFQKNIYFCFIDYAKAFDCVDHNKL